MVIIVNKRKLLKGVFIILSIAFIISYIIEVSGYYEYNLQNRTVLTNESMKKFEKDISDGKNVLLEDYAVPTSKDYTTTLTRNTNKVSTKVNKILKRSIEEIFKIMGSFVKD